MRVNTAVIFKRKPMIPKGLEYKHFEKAVEEIKENGVPKRRESNRYDLLFKGKKYPPKYVISIANKFVHGEEWPSEGFNAVEAKNYFIQNGYTILDKKKNSTISIIQHESSESKYPEGKEKYKLHKKLERDPSLGKKAKLSRLQTTGELRCDVCNFSFFEAYGELGVGFIEAHHTVPVSVLRGKRKTKLEEIALVCSNCHKMLHRGSVLLSINELKSLLKKI
jgi:predicted HNH restriction endonuclease